MKRSTAAVRVSRVTFCVDMTAPWATEIPICYLVEAAWPAKARWLGLIGRTRLGGHELALANLRTWPELETPTTLLDKVFGLAWEGGWGLASTALEEAWLRSPLRIETEAKDELLKDAAIRSAAGWKATRETLDRLLDDCGDLLSPLPVQMPPHRAAHGPKARRQVPRFRVPVSQRVRDDFAAGSLLAAINVPAAAAHAHI